MFKIRTITSLFVLALILLTTYQSVAAKTEVNPGRSYDPVNMIRNQGVFTSPLGAPHTSNRLTQEKCVDMPFGAVASVYACPDPSQIPVPVLWYQEANASKTSNADAPSDPSPVESCASMPFGAVASVHACPDPSQIPLPEWLIAGGKAPNQ